jgi:hypothetical protein
VVSNEDLLVVQQHTIDGLDSGLGSLSTVVVNEAITLRATTFVGRDLAGKDVAECSKGIMESLSRKVRMIESPKGQVGEVLPCCRSVRQGS